MLFNLQIYLYGNESRFNQELTTNASTTSVLVPRVVKGINYRIQMSAFNRMGEGEKSKIQFLGS
jgi:hypothetical protein